MAKGSAYFRAAAGALTLCALAAMWRERRALVPGADSLHTDLFSFMSSFVGEAAEEAPLLPGWNPATSRLSSSDDIRRALAVQLDAPSRQAFWYDCLNASFVPSCRPNHTTVPPILSHAEWEAHVNEVLAATHAMRREPYHGYAGYGAMWIENHWITQYLGVAEGSQTPRPAGEPPMTVATARGNTSLWTFYPLVPIFVQWTDGAFGPGKQYQHFPFKDLMMNGRVLRDDVLYVTLTQHDRGEPVGGATCNWYMNILVMSAGGWGNAVVPLIKGWNPPLEHTTAATRLARRSVLFNFVGTIHLGRDVMIAQFKFNTTLPKEGGHPMTYFNAGGGKWQEAAAASVFVLAPRGFGRTSFRLFEMLQAGRVPVYLSNDNEMWVPYQHTHDFMLPRDIPGAHQRGAGRADVSLFGAVQRRSAEESPGRGDVADYTPAAAAAGGTENSAAGIVSTMSGAGRYAIPLANVTSTVLNGGGMWGPGGVGFAIQYAEIPAFACIACEFLLPGSAARWRHVRTIALDAYSVAAGVAGASLAEGVPGCPCTTARWAAIVAALTAEAARITPSRHAQPPGFFLPADSLIAEMEDRARALVPSYFTYEAVMARVDEFVRSPLTSEMPCVPKPARYGVGYVPYIRRR